jgi:methyltransferase FkbM-like protein
VEVIEAAASRTSGEATLELGISSLDARLAGHESDGPGMLRVRTIGIDDALDRGTLAPPALVKIDAEGAEFDVLEGMVRTIEHHRPTILCEIHQQASASEMVRLSAERLAEAFGAHATLEGSVGKPAASIEAIDYRLELLEQRGGGELWAAQVIARPAHSWAESDS